MPTKAAGRASAERRGVAVSALSGLFGLGSWIAMTGLWVELPVLVSRLPEGWALASQLALVLQAANAGPVAYWLWARTHTGISMERWATHLQLAVGALSTLLLVFLWDSTLGDVSVSLFVLSFGLSLVDCTSSVVFLPYMAHFKPCYLTPYLVGEGLSGLLPSLLAMAQGVEQSECRNVTTTPQTVVDEHNGTDSEVAENSIQLLRFGPEWFFAFLLVMVGISWLAFYLLDTLALCRREMVASRASANGEMEMKTQDPLESKPLSLGESKISAGVDTPDRTRNPGIGNRSGTKDCSRRLYWWLLFLQCWASIATFGVFPAIQTYSCLPYGETPFHLAVTLCGLAYPAACLLAMWWQARNPAAIGWLCAAATLASVYAMAAAALSPEPPLVASPAGAPLIVICWVFFMFTFSYVKTMATVLLGALWGHGALFWCGAVTQGGAALGALLMFLLVNVFHLFRDDGLCDAS